MAPLPPPSPLRFNRPGSGASPGAAMLAAVCLLALAPSPAARGAGAGRSSAPRFNPPPVGRPLTPGLADRDLAAALARLPVPPSQGYDIVPPDPPSPVASSALPGYQIVPLGRAHFNRLCLAATVGSTKGLMMLDTGAQTTALSDTAYHSLLLHASSLLPAGLPTAVNLNGTRTPLVEAPNFYVGASNLGAVPVCLLPARNLVDPDPLDKRGRQYDGLLGENILRHYHAMIDCGRLLLYLNIDPARRLGPSAGFVRRGWTPVPMTDTGRVFTVPCVLNGHRFRLVVDTGSPFTNLDRQLLAAAQVGSHDLPTRGGLIGTPSKRAGLVDLDRLQIGGYTATDVHMTTVAQSLAAFGGPQDGSGGEPIVGLLGGDTLALNGAVVDLGNRVLYLKHPGKAAGHQELVKRKGRDAGI